MNTRLFLNKPLSFLIIVLLVVVLALTLSQRVAASTGCQPTVTVTSTGNSGPGTLRQAIVDVCEGGTIDFGLPLPDTITLTGGELVVDKLMNINGPGADLLAISAAGGRAVLNQAAGLQLSGLTIRDGDSIAGGIGMGVLNLGVMVISDSIIRDNEVDNLLGDPAMGAGVANFYGTLTIKNSALIQNIVDGNPGSIYMGGGGLANILGKVRIINSTISDNTAGTSAGGGIFNFLGTITISYSTIADNEAGDGGGIANGPGSVVFLHASVIGNNHYNDCESLGQIISLGHNLSSGDDCNLTGPGDLPNTAPLLGPLQDNGGSTPTHALLPGSPAIDAASLLRCPPTDQRGVSRPQGPRCDIGAYELEGVSE